MKILRISLRNLASLAGEHTLDFTQAPLAHTGLFTISGPTGSGKSTLLDALCLALYGETPRLTVVQGAVAVQDQGKDIQQKDARNLLRRGAADGFAEVAFSGVDGGLYTARWKIWRARNKPNGALQNAEQTLFRGNVTPDSEGERVASGKLTEVREKIIEKVGLSFDQFRRAVLLAQGDFATFLKARDGERAEILQALTGTERFQKISVAIFERTRSEEGLIADIRQKMGAQTPLEPEARSAAESALKDADAVQARIDTELQGRKMHEVWFTTEKAFHQKLGEAMKSVFEWETKEAANVSRKKQVAWVRLASMEARSIRSAELQNEAAIQSAKARINEGTQKVAALKLNCEQAKSQLQNLQQKCALESARQRDTAPFVAQARKLDGELGPLQESAERAREDLSVAEKARNKAVTDLSAQENERKILQTQRENLQTALERLGKFAPYAADIQAWMDRFRTESAMREKRCAALEKAEHSQKAAEMAHHALKKATANLPELRVQCEQAEKAKEDASKKFGQFDSEEIRKMRRHNVDLQGALREVREKLDLQQRFESDFQRLTDELVPLVQQMDRDCKRRDSLLKHEIPAAQGAEEHAQTGLRLAEAAVSEHAVILRASLRSGAGCPVCGATEHPYTTGMHSPESVALDALRQHLETAKTRHLQLLGELSGIEKALRERPAQIKEKEKALGKIEAEQKRISDFVPALDSVAEIWKERGEARELALAKELKEVGATLDRLDAAEMAKNQAQVELKIALERFEGIREKVVKAEASEQKAIAANRLAETQQTDAQAALDAANKEHEKAIESLIPVLQCMALKVTGQTPNWRETPLDKERLQFEQGANEWIQTQNRLTQIQHQESVCAAKIPGLMESQANTNKEWEMRNIRRADADRKLSEKRMERMGLLNGRSADEFEAALKRDLKTAEDQRKSGEEKYNQWYKEWNGESSLLKEQESGLVVLEKMRVEAIAAMNAWLQQFADKEHHSIDRAELDRWLGHDAAWIDEEQRQIDIVSNALVTARGKATAAKESLEAHIRTKPTADDALTVENEMIRLKRDLENARAEADTKRAVILNDDARKQQSGRLLDQLQLQEKQALPWRKLNALIGSADGTKFRDMAQQWTLDVLLKHANAQLGSLADRYRLERLRDSLNLLVIDREMDGQQRSVHSLSGGESFLVSLGLALGLASITSNKLAIESLFIDEGFGSLDSDTLRTALNALGHLEDQGRKVGVISHVRELVDAIPVQVRVVRGPGGASRIVI